MHIGPGASARPGDQAASDDLHILLSDEITSPLEKFSGPTPADLPLSRQLLLLMPGSLYGNTHLSTDSAIRPKCKSWISHLLAGYL